MKVIVINGFPLSGKDSFCDLCLNYMTSRGIMGGKISTIDAIKKLAIQIGWSGLKEPKDRKFLSDLKDLCTEYNDFPFEIVKEQISQTYLHFTREMQVPEDKVVFFVHCREPKEIQKFVDILGAETLIVRREEVEKLPQSNHADEEVLNFEYTYTIENNSNIEELNQKAVDFINELVKF